MVNILTNKRIIAIQDTFGGAEVYQISEVAYQQYLAGNTSLTALKILGVKLCHVDDILVEEAE